MDETTVQSTVQFTLAQLIVVDKIGGCFQIKKLDIKERVNVGPTFGLWTQTLLLMNVNVVLCLVLYQAALCYFFCIQTL